MSAIRRFQNYIILIARLLILFHGGLQMEPDFKSFQMTYRVVNKTADELIVKAKGGLGYIVRRCKEPIYNGEHQLFVDIPSAYLDNLIIDENAALTKLDKALLSVIKAEISRIRASISCFPQMFPHNIHVVVKLTDAHVEKNNAIHSEMLGVTFYIGAENARRPALNTPAYTQSELLEMGHPSDEQPKGGFHYYVYVNDVKRTSNPFYTNVMGRAYEVPVVMDESRNPGVYVGVVSGNETPQTLYYTFEDLDKNAMETLGLFKTRVDCENGANTDRAIKAERKVADCNKEIDRLSNELGSSYETVKTLEDKNTRLLTDLSQLKLDHKTEIGQLKHEQWIEMSHLKHQNKVSGDIFKFEGRMKDTVTKANMDLVKQRSAVNTWGEFGKAAGAIAGLGLTFYKLFTT